MTVVYKQLSTICELQNLYNRYGCNSKLFVDGFDFKIRYLKENPVAPCTAPSFMWRGRHSQKACMTIGIKFWEYLSTQAMVDSHFIPNTIEEQRGHILKDKLLLTTQSPNVLSLLRDLLPLDGDYHKVAELKDAARSQMKAIEHMARFNIVSSTKLKAAKVVIDDDTNEIAHTMHAFPGGRAVLVEALLLQRAKEKQVGALTDVAEHLHEAVTSFPLEKAFDAMASVPPKLRICKSFGGADTLQDSFTSFFDKVHVHLETVTKPMVVELVKKNDKIYFASVRDNMELADFEALQRVVGFLSGPRQAFEEYMSDTHRGMYSVALPIRTMLVDLPEAAFCLECGHLDAALAKNVCAGWPISARRPSNSCSAIIQIRKCS